MSQENLTPDDLSVKEHASAFIMHLTDLNNALIAIWMLTKQQQEGENLFRKIISSNAASDRLPNQVV